MIKVNKNYLIRISVLLLVLLITLLTISGRGCHKRKKSNNNNVGSSDPWASIPAPSLYPLDVYPYWKIDISWAWGGTTFLDGFTIERSTNGTNYEALATVGPSINSYSDITSFNFSTTYYYRVQAFNAFARSDWAIASATMPIPSTVAAVAGERFCITLNLNGTLWGWGNNEYSQLGLGDTSPYTITIPAPLGNDTDWANIAAGYWHTLALKTNRTLWSWGSNNLGQLGVGNSDFDDRTTPAPVGTDSDWFVISTNISKIAAGANHSLGIKTNSTLWAWGGNWLGQLGLGYSTISTTGISTPSQVGTNSDWSFVTAGGLHSLAIKNNGSIWAWGWNGFGQLGLTDNISRTSPSQVGSVSDWAMVTAGYSQTAALKTNSTLWNWGREGFIYTPRQVGTDSDWRTISTGGADSGSLYILAIKKSGTLWSWEQNQFSQLGLGDNLSYRISPNQIGNSSNWFSVTTGGYHSIAFNINGTIYVWGLNDTWQLGLGDSINRNIPCLLGSPAPPSSLSAVIGPTQINLSWVDQADNEIGFKIERKTNLTGTYEQIATVGIDVVSWIDTPPAIQNTYYCYRIRAYNSFENSPYSNEAAVAASGSWSKISASSNHTIGLKTNGTLWAWGQNESGQLGLGDAGEYTNRYTPTQIGNGSEWSTVSCGDIHTFGIKTNKTLWGWGDNNADLLGIEKALGNIIDSPTQLGTGSDWSKVSCGNDNYTFGIKTDKTLWSWGSNSIDYGQLGLGDEYTDNVTSPTQVGTSSDWSSVTPGGYSKKYAFALKTNNTLWAWGFNSAGYLGLGDTNGRNTPSRLGTSSDWSVVSCGLDYTMGLKTNKTIWAWGNNESGRLGLGDTADRYTPTQIGAGSDWSAVSCGWHTIGIKTNKTIWAWGFNNWGALGLGDNITRDTPTQLGTDSDWSSVSCGEYHTISIKTNAILWAWGDNANGQLGLGDIDNKLIPTLVGE